ncbi:phenolphthiocerol/phthiocerol polyketide synthase subunit C-like isoform X2 [Biomphalaria glabrata]|nr:phenolphthiocerol/phthiocerol polyketide synthase subunit C-like isoform X2 [Biomphalaria glabrata]XP_055894490.1 phenolphthiocerol/phthiocerol polyketide synthase subunit C-like isoform X2 [Biomphalaria glabrata]
MYAKHNVLNNEATTHKDAIAIIGIGFKGPGAENLEQLWEVLEGGKNYVLDLPKDRWNVDAFYDPDPQATGKYYTRKAGLLSNPLDFDNTFFDINDIESDQMDPQQKFVLECSYRAMEHAGITRRSIQGSKTGVYIGAMNCDYRGLFPVGYSVVSNYTVTGVSNSIIAARVSYAFDLRGPCMVLDTGCSSALLAIHTASQALLNGDCTMAICGGTNFIGSPDIFIHLSKAQMVSPTGQCHAFSEQADGYTRGEGCGIVLLKKLSDAERENDKILAVITTGTNQDGHTVTPISAPSMSQQIQLLEDMYRDLSLEQLDEIEYIEAHGTGTQAGDYAEANALGKFFKKRGSSKKRLIGSIKTNIGHLESAAGVVGLIKVLLMMQHHKFVPSLFSESLNKRIDFEALNLVVASQVKDWTTENKVGSVNSFGFGGSNCHAVVRSVVQRDCKKAETTNQVNKACVVCFSGKTVTSLMGSLRDLANYKRLKLLDVRDIAYTSTCRRSHYRERKALIVASIDDLIDQVNLVLNSDQQETNFKDPQIVFVFGGMGTSWTGMCEELLERSPVFQETIKEIDNCLKKYVTWSLYQRLANRVDLNDHLVSPIAIFACQVGLARLWLSLGVKPGYTVGQSVGEVAAAYICGHLSLHDAVKVIYTRSLLLSKVVGGKMFIVRNMDVKEIEAIVDSCHSYANVSVVYSSTSCAISSESDKVDAIKKQLLHEANKQNLQLSFTDLPVPTAYHSHRMDTIKFKLQDALAEIVPQTSPKFQMVSTVTGENIQTLLDSSYWVKNLREPVRFSDAIRSTYKPSSGNTYIEISPKPVLKAHMQDIFKEENVELVVSMTPNSEWKTLLEGVAKLYCQGVDIDWKTISQYERVVTPVPRYCFDCRKGFYKSEAAHLSLAGVDCLRLSHPFVYQVNDTESMVMISQVTFPSVYEHKVSNILIVPGAFYVEVGLAISKSHLEMKAPMYTVSAQFEQAHRLSREGSTLFQVECIKMSSKRSELNPFVSYKINVKHEGTVLACLTLNPLTLKLYLPKDNIQFLKAKCVQRVQKDDIYSLLKQYGFTYGPKFSLLVSAWKSMDECIAEIAVPTSLAREIPGTTLHPSIIDCMIQASVILAEGFKHAKELLPKGVEKLTCFRAIETQMYIIATKRGHDRDLDFYDVKLTSLDGHVIALMENLSHKILSRNTENIDTAYQCVWTKLDSVYPKVPQRKPKVLFLTDLIPVCTPMEINNQCLKLNIINHPWDVFKGKLPTLNSSIDFIVILIANCNVNDSEEGDVVLQKTLNLCLFLQQMYNCAFNQRYQNPIFVFTKGAFAPVDGTQSNPADVLKSNTVNPIMTSLWGMFRCAVHEPIHEYVFALDLHIPTESLSLSLLASIAELINSDIHLKTYPEFIVTETQLYVNQIITVDKDLRVPSFRLNHTDSRTSHLVLSRHPSICDNTLCIYDKNSASVSTPDTIAIRISNAAIQNPHLYSLAVPYCEDNSITEKNYLVYALEFQGSVFVSDSKTRSVVSCFPFPVASKIHVPKDVVIDSSLLFQYKPGDLTKLTVLFSLCRQVKTRTVTVLASENTFHLAQCLNIMLKTTDSSIRVAIINIEQLHFEDSINLEETVVSLILTDPRIISALALMKTKPKHFITMYKLIEDVVTLFSQTLASVHLDFIDTKQLFAPCVLTKTIPQVAEWIKQHRLELNTVLQSLHEDNNCFDENTFDLRKLLEVSVYSLSEDYVRAGKSDLFLKDSLYIVVGGLTGLGWLTVKYLAENGAGCIAIFNRRSASDEKKSEMNQLSKSTHCLIEVFSVDVTKMGALKALMNSLKSRLPNKTLRGVFFSAAILQDQPLLEMKKDDFLKVLQPKVAGAWNMHLLTKDTHLDYFVMYSSVASVVGNFSQANYGTGNAFMDGLAFYRRSFNLSGQSINWGALDLGMLEGNDEVKKKLESKGFVIMPEEVICKYMQPMLLLNWTQLMPCQFNQQISENTFSGAPARLRRRMTSLFRWFQKEEVQVKEDTLSIARDLPPDQRLAIYEQFVVDLATQILNLPRQTLRRDSNLVDYGLDSIVAMTMITYIYRHAGCRLHLFQFISGHAAVQDIAKSIDEAISNVP